MEQVFEIAEFEETGGLPDAASPPPAESREGREFSAAEGFWATLGVLPHTLYWGMHAACLLGFLVRPGRR